jgi:hypothetical protein
VASVLGNVPVGESVVAIFDLILDESRYLKKQLMKQLHNSTGI